MLYYFTIRFYEEEINGCKICYSEKRGAWNHIEICNTIEINVQAFPGSKTSILSVSSVETGTLIF
jgi:hypothetical protein